MLLPDLLFNDKFDILRQKPTLQDAGILRGGSARGPTAAPIPATPPPIAVGVPGIRYYLGGMASNRVTAERSLTLERYRVLYRTGADVQAGDVLAFADGVSARVVSLLRQGGGMTQAECELYDG